MHVDRPVAVIAHAKPLIGGVAPHEDGAQQVQRVLLQDHALICEYVRVGQVDDQRGVVVAQVRAQLQRLRVIHHELQPRQKPGVAVEHSVTASGGCAHVAKVVEDNEGVVVLERAPRP